MVAAILGKIGDPPICPMTGVVNYGSDPYAHTGALNDVVGGSNGSCGGSYLCTAVGGFDGPTGLGTPNGTGAF